MRGRSVLTGHKKFRGFNQIKKFLRHVLHKLALIILAKKIVGARCTLIKGSLTVYRNSPIELIFFSCLFVCFFLPATELSLREGPCTLVPNRIVRQRRQRWQKILKFSLQYHIVS